MLVLSLVLMMSWCAFAHHTTKATQITILGDQVKWVNAPPMLPSGAMMAVLEGNPMKPGPFTIRMKAPAAYKIPPHWHSADEHITVLSGTLNLGMGGKFDTSMGKSLPAGSYIVLPAGMKHFAWTDEETVIQLHGMGPWNITYVNPADNPMKHKQ